MKRFRFDSFVKSLYPNPPAFSITFMSCSVHCAAPKQFNKKNEIAQKLKFLEKSCIQST